MLCNVATVVKAEAPVYTSLNPDIESEDAREVFGYLNLHSSPDDVVACGESRAIYLYTGRLSCNLSGKLDDMQATADWYVEFLFRQTYLQYPHSTFRENRYRFEKVLQNNTFAVYRIVKP